MVNWKTKTGRKSGRGKNTSRGVKYMSIVGAVGVTVEWSCRTGLGMSPVGCRRSSDGALPSGDYGIPLQCCRGVRGTLCGGRNSEC
jgi:hypothetical protein